MLFGLVDKYQSLLFFFKVLVAFFQLEKNHIDLFVAAFISSIIIKGSYLGYRMLLFYKSIVDTTWATVAKNVNKKRFNYNLI